jgi:type II restriction/modification system DNA methylase subunit YeeA
MLMNYARVCNPYSGFFALVNGTSATECAEKALFSGLSRHVSCYGLRIKDGRKIDPACGSGHFLLSAAQTIAVQLSHLRSEGDSPDGYRNALREVIRHCIYGVDLNPMAVELTKISLWLESYEPGKPLGFLDNHIRVGNSLLGVFEPSILADGIPNDAVGSRIKGIGNG